jgi:hypothetical protein
MTTDELVERVARAIERSMENARLFSADKSPYEPEARAAIAIALEEAARVADEIAALEDKLYATDGDRYAQGKAAGAKIIAAAIRALIHNPEGAPLTVSEGQVSETP